ncbi:hypothetical protein GPLA_2125 [Paraglaciecola polaris LMG 21857]|uniref:Uncharacterized protein n=1 Tax=Paraglaciecola polaris LMG 21857 TaxID=1129793 RepID=K7ACE8_9ALTE|nr:hypothetical protein GPLA_2125 [Paraglaciecola polaris LMG 21857]
MQAVNETWVYISLLSLPKALYLNSKVINRVIGTDYSSGLDLILWGRRAMTLS